MLNEAYFYVMYVSSLHERMNYQKLISQYSFSIVYSTRKGLFILLTAITSLCFKCFIHPQTVYTFWHQEQSA